MAVVVAAAAAATCKLSERNMNYVDNQSDEDDGVGDHNNGNNDKEHESELLIWLKLSIRYFVENFWLCVVLRKWNMYRTRTPHDLAHIHHIYIYLSIFIEHAHY